LELALLGGTQSGDRVSQSNERDDQSAACGSPHLTTTRATSARLAPTVDDSPRLGFLTRDQSLAWLDAEYPNLTTATYAATGHLSVARGLPAAMRDFLL
jgi:hypothetical protein